MSALLRIYDDVTSNKYVSLGINFTSTAYATIKMINCFCTLDPMFFTISACAGVALALISNTYLVHNEKIKDEGERNSVYALLSLVLVFGGIHRNRTYSEIFNRIFGVIKGDNWEVYNSCRLGFLNGFGVGFLATTLALQLIEGKTKIKFRSPIVFD